MIDTKNEQKLESALSFGIPPATFFSAYLSQQDYQKLLLFGVSEIVRQLDTSTPSGAEVEVTNFPAIYPISATSLPLPALASTSTLQTTGNTSLSSIDTKITACDTGAVTIAGGTITLPVGAATETTLSALNTKVTACDTGAVVISSSTSLPIYRVPNTAATYQASIAALTVAASATDIFTITGSASKTVYITKITISATRTSGAQTLLQLIKRSAANSGGTSSTPTRVPFDSTSAAATATVNAYTVNPTPGTAVGTLYSANHYIAGTSTATTPITFDFGATLGQPITLRGTSEVLAVNLNGVTVTGGSFNITVEWEES